MNYAIMILLCLFSFSAFAAEITDAKAAKNLDIICGNQTDGSIRLVIGGTSALVYVNGATSASATQNIAEQAGGDYSVTMPDDIIVRFSKESLQATVYKVYFPPYTELPIKRVDCTWAKK
jgi:hypothetical protein